jgi:hypothetical protein
MITCCDECDSFASVLGKPAPASSEAAAVKPDERGETGLVFRDLEIENAAFVGIGDGLVRRVVGNALDDAGAGRGSPGEGRMDGEAGAKDDEPAHHC